MKLIRSELKNYLISTKTANDNEQGIHKVLAGMAKRMQNSHDEYSKLGRADFAEAEKNQRDLVVKYLDKIPVADHLHVDSLMTKLLADRKVQGEDMPLAKEILKELDMVQLAKEWKTTEKDIRKSLFTLYQKLYK